MADRSRDWMEQAERDLAVARGNAQLGYHEWACFAAQQAAEKAIKAVHYSRLRHARTHVLANLLESLEEDIPEMLLERARVLDGYYIPTRYANGHDYGAPFKYFGKIHSEQAIENAGLLIEFARSCMAESR